MINFTVLNIIWHTAENLENNYSNSFERVGGLNFLGQKNRKINWTFQRGEGERGPTKKPFKGVGKGILRMSVAIQILINFLIVYFVPQTFKINSNTDLCCFTSV